VVKAELWHGAQKYERKERRLVALQRLFGMFSSLPFDDAAAQHYAAIRHELELRGSVIGPNDLMIAAICLAHDLTLVSGNTREFNRVTGLQVEDWSQP
jgi:tRNA(fMet)-specific endonuclease VapC